MLVEVEPFYNNSSFLNSNAKKLTLNALLVLRSLFSEYDLH